MTRKIKFRFRVNAPEDYRPIPEYEKDRVLKLTADRLLKAIDGFDGGVKVTITIQSKGNA